MVCISNRLLKVFVAERFLGRAKRPLDLWSLATAVTQESRALHVLRLVEMTTGEVLIWDDIWDVSTTLEMTWQELMPRTRPLPGSYPWLDWSFLSNTDRVIVRTQYIYSCAYNTYRLLTISMYSLNPLPGCGGLSSRARSTSGRLLPQGRKKPRNLVRPPLTSFRLIRPRL